MFTPTGQQLTVFNKQSKILVGGKKDGSGRIIRPFKGTIAGKWSIINRLGWVRAEEIFMEKMKTSF